MYKWHVVITVVIGTDSGLYESYGDCLANHFLNTALGQLNSSPMYCRYTDLPRNINEGELFWCLIIYTLYAQIHRGVVQSIPMWSVY